MLDNSVPQSPAICQDFFLCPPATLKLDDIATGAVPDGVHPFDDPVDQWVVILAGEVVNYAIHQSTAWFQYNEALRLQQCRTSGGR